MFDWKAFDKCYMHGVAEDTCDSALATIDHRPLQSTSEQPSDELIQLLPCLTDVLKAAKDDQIKVLIVGKDQATFSRSMEYRGCVAHFKAVNSCHMDVCRSQQIATNKTTQVTPHTQFFNLDFAMVGKKFGRPTSKKTSESPALEGSHSLLELSAVYPLSHQLTKEMVDRQIYFGNEFTKLRETLGNSSKPLSGDHFNLLLRSEVTFLESNRNVANSELELQKAILKKRIREKAS